MSQRDADADADADARQKERENDDLFAYQFRWGGTTEEAWSSPWKPQHPTHTGTIRYCLGTQL